MDPRSVSVAQDHITNTSWSYLPDLELLQFMMKKLVYSSVNLKIVFVSYSWNVTVLVTAL